MSTVLKQKIGSEEFEQTLDLRKLAGVGNADRILVVGQILDRTEVLFQKTLTLLEAEDRQRMHNSRELFTSGDNRFVPENPDLRKLFLFAEAVGSYSTLNDLDDVYSPAYSILQHYAAKSIEKPLASHQVRLLENYYQELSVALEHANRYLMEHFAQGFTADEIHGLHKLLISAQERAEEIRRILGTHYTHQIEFAVKRLAEFHAKIASVEKTISGIFLVDSEVMFIPTNDLIECVNDLFKAIGNPYVADSIDGLLLLAARNLLIEAVSFYSFYGKNQIFHLFQKPGVTVNPRTITRHIRYEIRKLFEACQQSNKLVLRRMVRKTLTDFELSVRAIQQEAEQVAVRTVRQILPKPATPAPMVSRRGWFRRILKRILN
jgi:hypothetical protein